MTLHCSEQKKLLILMARHYMCQRRARLELVNRRPTARAVMHGAPRYVAALFGVDHRRVQEALTEYDPKGKGLAAQHIELNSGSDTDSDCNSTPHKTKMVLTAKEISATREHVHRSLRDGRTLTWRQVHQFVVAEFGFEGSAHTTRRRLIAEGFGVLKTSQRPAHNFQTPYWAKQKERFVLQMAEAFEEERAGRAVIVWMDESFVHNHHHRRITVVDTTSATDVAPSRRAKPKAVLPIGAGGGQLQIVVHAMTRDGLLVERDADGRYVRTSAMTAGLVYAAGKKSKKSDGTAKEGYHAHWDGESFVLWVRRQLIPTFVKVYGAEKRMYLVLDNSGNHSRRSPEHWVSVSSAKPVLAAFLEKHGVRAITVDRGMKTVPATRYAPARRGRPATNYIPAHEIRDIRTFQRDEWRTDAPHGPSKEELQERVRALYSEQPALTESLLERLFADGVSGAHTQPINWAAVFDNCLCCVVQITAETDRELKNGLTAGLHKVVWTVPYMSECNPIEIVWAKSKGHAASKNDAKSSVASVKSAMLDGLYGDGQGFDGVTAAFCTRIIGHAKAFLKQWIDGSPALCALLAGSRSTDIDSLTAVRRALYGPIVRAHRAVRGRRAADADDDNGSGDDDADDGEAVDGVLPPLPPAPSAASASASASASS